MAIYVNVRNNKNKYCGENLPMLHFESKDNFVEVIDINGKLICKLMKGDSANRLIKNYNKQFYKAWHKYPRGFFYA